MAGPPAAFTENGHGSRGKIKPSRGTGRNATCELQSCKTDFDGYNKISKLKMAAMGVGPLRAL